MDGITPDKLWALLLSVAAAVVLLANASEKIVRIINAVKAPNKQQNERLDEVEEHMREIDGYLNLDKKRLDDIEEGNRVTQRALLALLDHGIDGNNTSQMQKAKAALEEHLISR